MWSDVDTGSLLLLFSPQLYLILCNPMDYSMPGFPVLPHLPEFAQTHVHWLNEAMQPSPPQSPPSPPALNLSQHRGLLQWLGSPQQVLENLLPKYWSFRFSMSPSCEYSGLMSFRIDWFDLLVVQGTVKSLHQHHSLKASILQCSAFFIVQLSHLYMTTRKTIALTIRAFVGKVMSSRCNQFKTRSCWIRVDSNAAANIFKKERRGSFGQRRHRHTLGKTAMWTWKQKLEWRTSLVVQWLRLHAPNAGGLDSIPG